MTAGEQQVSQTSTVQISAAPPNTAPPSTTGTRLPRIVYAGNRDISVWVLQYLIDQGVYPHALLIPDAKRASHTDELRALCAHLPENAILVGDSLWKPESVAFLQSLDLDYLLCIHFPYIVSPSALGVARHGVLNLHPAYLPWNRGWHTPSWALLEETPIGATLHFMDEGLDTGDIIHQLSLEPQPDDTANTLYARLKQLEYQVFVDAWPSLATYSYQRRVQRHEPGTHRKRKELFAPHVQELRLDEPTTARALLRTLRALTTNNLSEAAYFDNNGERYRVQVRITREALPTPQGHPPQA